MADNVQDVKRTFELALDIGCHSGNMITHLYESSKVKEVISLDIAEEFLKDFSGIRVCSYDESLPFKTESFDMVCSAFYLQWIDNIPSFLKDVLRVLKPDGLFMAAFAGGNSLYELKESLIIAESKLYGGASQRLIPFIKVNDAATIMQKANFALPVVNVIELKVTYPNLKTLITDIKSMGESNAMYRANIKPMSRQLLKVAEEIYWQNFSDESKLSATYEIIVMSGWKQAIPSF